MQQKGWTHSGNITIFGLLLIGLVLVFLLNIALGSIKISLPEVIKIIVNHIQDDSTYSTIVWKIRLPRSLAAITGGAAIAVSGLLLQVFFRNPVVDAYVLGVSSGATLLMALVTLGGFTLGLAAMSPMYLFLGALMGALGVTAVILVLAYRVRSPVTLLVIGLMIGYLCSAATGLLTTFADNEKLKGFMIWSLGSFSGFTWPQVKMVILISVPFLFLALLISKPLNSFLLGEDYAKSMGVNTKLFRLFIILVSSVLTAAVTAFAGPVAFVGMAVPHISRLSLRTSDNRLLVPATILLGGMITALCDLTARTILAPAELTISTITSFFGVPIVIWLLMKRGSEL
jgi:iron complex transport system permease protein